MVFRVFVTAVVANVCVVVGVESCSAPEETKTSATPGAGTVMAQVLAL